MWAPTRRPTSDGLVDAGRSRARTVSPSTVNSGTVVASDDLVLRAAIQAAAQVISGESGLQRRTRCGCTPGANGTLSASWVDQRIDVGLRGRDAVGFVTVRQVPRHLDPLDDRAGGQRAAGAHRDQRRALVGALQLVERGGDQAGCR